MSEDTLSDEWTVIQDFTSVELDHSLPKFEAKLHNGGEMVLIRETAPMSGVEQHYELPTDVFREIADSLPESDD